MFPEALILRVKCLRGALVKSDPLEVGLMGNDPEIGARQRAAHENCEPCLTLEEQGACLPDRAARGLRSKQILHQGARLPDKPWGRPRRGATRERFAQKDALAVLGALHERPIGGEKSVQAGRLGSVGCLRGEIVVEKPHALLDLKGHNAVRSDTQNLELTFATDRVDAFPPTGGPAKSDIFAPLAKWLGRPAAKSTVAAAHNVTTLASASFISANRPTHPMGVTCPTIMAIGRRSARSCI